MAASRQEQEEFDRSQESEQAQIDATIDLFTDVSIVYTLNYKTKDDEYTENVDAMIAEYNSWISLQNEPRVKDLYQCIQMYGKKYTILYKETEADQGKSSRQGIPNNRYTIWVIPYTPDPGSFIEHDNYIIRCELGDDDFLYLEDFLLHKSR